MPGYNGFSTAIQNKSTTWMFAQIKKGIIAEYPSLCDCCGQDKGRIGYHAESYAVPFGPHIVAFDLCHLCHVFVHADDAKYGFRKQEYAAQLASGHRFKNFSTFNWGAAKARYLNATIMPRPVDPSLYSIDPDRDLELMMKMMRGDFNPQKGADPFWAPAKKRAMFEGRIGMQSGMPL